MKLRRYERQVTGESTICCHRFFEPLSTFSWVGAAHYIESKNSYSFKIIHNYSNLVCFFSSQMFLTVGNGNLNLPAFFFIAELDMSLFHVSKCIARALILWLTPCMFGLLTSGSLWRAVVPFLDILLILLRCCCTAHPVWEPKTQLGLQQYFVRMCWSDDGLPWL